MQRVTEAYSAALIAPGLPPLTGTTGAALSVQLVDSFDKLAKHDIILELKQELIRDKAVGAITKTHQELQGEISPIR